MLIPMADKTKRKWYRKKKYVVPIVILVLLIIFRILLPYIVEDYVNKTLNNIPGYEGHVTDVDLNLYRGAYELDSLVLKKEEAPEGHLPLINFPKSDISIEWKSLWKGKVVSEIILYDPVFNYIFEDQQKEDPEGDPQVDDWTKALTSLVPIDINHFEVRNGTANFVKLSADPQISLYMNQIQLQATNLSNVVNTMKKLPSKVTATAVSIGGGSVTLNADMDLLKTIPDMDVNFALKRADVTALNDVIKNFIGVDFQSGTFELYSEFAIADAYLKGYIKPMFIDTKLLGKDDDNGILEKLWEGFVGVFKFLLKNQGTDTLATRAPLEGDLNKVETGIWPTVLNIFKNAWFEAFKGNIDENIEFEDAERADEDKRKDRKKDDDDKDDD